MPRQASKCREWEKDRRDRLNNSFTELSKKLPCYQPSINISKIEILQKATAYIDELDAQVKDLLTNNASKATCEKIKKLRDQIRKLLIRNEQLCNLLKDAGIRYPSECGLVKFKAPKKWANKISPDQANILAEKEAQKENNNSNSLKEKKPDKTKKKNNVLRSVQKARVRRKEHKKMVQSAFRLNVAQSNLLRLVTTQSCFIITNTPKVCQSNVTKTTTVLTDSRILSTPLVASSIKPTGTVFVANNNILPFIPQPALVPTPILASNSPIVLNTGLPTANNIVPAILSNTSILVNTNMSNSISVKINQNQKCTVSNPTAISGTSTTTCLNLKSNANVSSSTNLPKLTTKSLPPLRPKAYTRTTQVNKVPIPALSSEYNKCLLRSIKLSSNNSSNSIKKYSKKKKEAERNGSLNKSITIKHNIVLNNKGEQNSLDTSEKDNDKKLAEKKENVNEIKEQVDNDVTEAPEKKIKLDDESCETKKLATPLTYSIDALCNDNPETSSTILETTFDKNDESNLRKNIEDQSNTNEIKNEPITTITKEKKHENNSTSESVTSLESANLSQKGTAIHEKKQDTTIKENVPKEVEVKVPELNDALGHSELSNDIFASLSHVAAGGQNPESTSPTAAFLLAFPLVSSLNSLKVAEVIEDEATESQRGTPTLLQIGTMDTAKTTQSHTDTLTPSLLNLDNFSFFPKEFYPGFDIIGTTAVNTNSTDTITTLTSGTSSTTNSTAIRNSTITTTTAINGSSNCVVNKTTSLQTSIIPITTISSANNNKVHCSSSNNMASNTSHNNKNSSKHGSFEVTKNISSQVYSITKTEATYSMANISSIKPERSSRKMGKPSNMHLMDNYTPSNANYNFSYNNSVFSSNETVPSNTVSISTEKEKQKSEKKTSCYYPTNSCYSLSNVTSNYTVSTATTASYSLPIVTTAPYSVTVMTSHPLPIVTTISQYNTFNPFTDLPTKTSSYIAAKPYNDMLYTNNSYTYTYGDNLNTTYTGTRSGKDKAYYGFNYDNYEYKEFQKPYEGTRNHNQTYCYNNGNQSTHQSKGKQSLKAIPNNTNDSNNSTTNIRQPVNWMTTPDVRQQSQDFIPFSKEMEFVPSTIYSSFASVTQNSYFNNNSYTTGDFHTTFPESRKMDTFPTIPNSLQRSEEENQFSWSPSKLPPMLDPPHGFMSSTLPTLVGDLALGTQAIFPEQKEKSRVKETKRNKLQNNFDSSQNNFLSVSQLVDHNKANNGGSVNPNRVANRRSSGSANRSSSKNSSNKTTKRNTKGDNNIKEIQNYETTGNKTSGNENKQQIKHQENQNNYNLNQNNNTSSDWLVSTQTSHKNRNVKNPSNSYSAEALIGHQNSDINRQRDQQTYNSIVNKSLPVPFLTENLLHYFPPVDLPQENNLLPQNQNYHQASSFGHNFASTIQNNVYTNNTFVPTNLNLPDISGNMTDYNNAGVIDNTLGHVVLRPPEKFNKPKNIHDRQEDKRTVQSSNNNTCSLNQLNSKKSKKKQPEPTLPGLVDFSFLPIPGAINSPILPDDFHAHTNFLPPPPTPTQLYPCKNSLYTKPAAELSHNPLLPLPPVTRSGVPHPEISPSLNSVGSSLTNFNLSTIFPEINKGSSVLDNMYPDVNKTKDYPHRDFLGTPQVPFSKTNPPMSYIHSTPTNN